MEILTYLSLALNYSQISISPFITPILPTYPPVSLSKPNSFYLKPVLLAAPRISHYPRKPLVSKSIRRLRWRGKLRRSEQDHRKQGTPKWQRHEVLDRVEGRACNPLGFRSDYIARNVIVEYEAL
ncbi:Uncharacterized protein Fot_33314 [Forsythia ovata]|uniref:Uncharacterized protein n=1 Tax=Forsythia ovata TaxID=205694 RepID=A0ABD1TAA2_9LAMI